LTNCPNPVGLDNHSSGTKDSSNPGDIEQSPWNKDFEITGLSHYYNYDDEERAAKIVAKPGTTAEITAIYYKGVEGTVYGVSGKETKAPKAIGNYAVTFDITDEAGNVIKGLYAGILMIEGFDKWLAKQPQNTTDTPYKVKWYSSNNTRVTALRNTGRYAEIDLSDSNIANISSWNATGLTSITLPDSVTSIGDSAFGGCTNLASVNLGNKVNTIGNFVFMNCYNLTSIEIPNSVESIGYQSFENCISLQRVILSNNITQILFSSFTNCPCLTEITIPAKVTKIGYDAFGYCSLLTSVTFEGMIATGNATIGIDSGAFLNNLHSKVDGTPGTTYKTELPIGTSAWVKQ
jgi:hypothetical protein